MAILEHSKKEINMYLGLDISTSCIGVAILDFSGKCVYCEHIDLKKIDSHFEKALETEKQLQWVYNHIRISKSLYRRSFNEVYGSVNHPLPPLLRFLDLME